MDDPEGSSKSKTRRKAPPAPNQQQAADYIAEASLELMKMAGQADMPFLAYLLDMALQEAALQSESPRRRRTDKQ